MSLRSPDPPPRSASRVVRVLHPCLEPLPSAAPLPGSRLIHRQRMGVLLQAAGLLALLDRAGWRVADWSAARVAADGRLTLAGGGVEPVRTPRFAQELLRDLLARLFERDGDAGGSGGILGPGEAKRAARSLREAWSQSLAPLPWDQAVTQLLEEASFLWEPDFGAARAALAGEIHDLDGEGSPRVRLWVAGPAAFRRGLLARCRSLDELRDRLAAPDAREVWTAGEHGEPRELAAARRWREAVQAWERTPPGSEEERVERAGALAALGRFEPALAELARLGSVPAQVLRAVCQVQMGQLFAARATLTKLEGLSIPAEQAVVLAEIAPRVLASFGRANEADPWLLRAMAGTAQGPPPLALRARLAAALAAWDRKDMAAMDLHLEGARAAADHPEIAWRWHQARALCEGDGSRAAAHAAQAIRGSRRFLARHEAAALWSDLGMARAGAGDLAGAERAFLHAVRLMEGCDGPRKTTLALFNLAEIRLRRGRCLGVREILEQSTVENRRAGNLRAAIQDTELWIRLELLLGRPEAAFALCREALAQKLEWRQDELHLLAARALGWLGRPAEAAAELELTPPGTLRELEPEERPAVFAQAGDGEAARREAGALSEPGLRALWAAALAGQVPPASAWTVLCSLEPYRAARLVFDLERIVPGAAPPDIRRKAASILRELGAGSLAGELEARDRGAWATLALLFTLLAREPVEPAPDADPPLATAPPAERRADSGEIVGESPALLAALARLDLLAAGDLPVILLGESGTGKELAARRLHRASPRSRAPFVAVNCAALSETLILSDLFGHARGAFTGAERDRAGVFETAQGGTVFLDEIGDLPLVAQGLLLRVLQEGEVRRVGESLPRKVKVRILAATHRDLVAMVAAGTFRQDLYYRLKVGSVELPPLRDRGEDLLRLAETFLSRLQPAGLRLSREAGARLLVHSWPGNVRELQNTLSMAAALASGGVIRPEHLELPEAGIPSPSGTSYHEQMEAFRRHLLASTLAVCGGNQSEAARRLGLQRQSYSYLVRKLKIV